MVSDMPYIHPAVSDTGTTVIAAAGVDFHPDQIKPVKQSKNGPQWAEETAEAPVAEDACQPDDQHDDELPGKENPKHTELTGVGRI